MESATLLQMLSARSSSSGDNFFHEACKAGSLPLLRRVEQLIDEPIPTILNQKNFNCGQCTHIIVGYGGTYAREMMEIVVHLGANINGQEGHGGFTPLHLCIWKENWDLSEWLCQAPGIDLEATNCLSTCL